MSRNGRSLGREAGGEGGKEGEREEKWNESHAVTGEGREGGKTGWSHVKILLLVL